MIYIVNDNKYSLSYKELKDYYNTFVECTDAYFMNNLPTIIHLACMIAFLKELPSEVVLSDEGIIHELAHLIHIPDEPVLDLQKIRKQFKEELELK